MKYKGNVKTILFTDNKHFNRGFNVTDLYQPNSQDANPNFEKNAFKHSQIQAFALNSQTVVKYT